MIDAVQQIKDRLSILDVVASYVELHKAGKNYKGKSPFSNERTPSFYVSPERGMYYCFSTNQGGDMFTFVETMEGVDFKGALKILAEKAGVELVPISPEKQTEQERLYAVLEAAAVYFEEQRKKHEMVDAYLQNRGVTPMTSARWRLGFAPGPPSGWRLLREALLQQKFTDDEMLRAGLIKQTDAGKAPYDVFRNRVMFPLFDQGGRVVAFSGRTIESGDDIPKYVNSPETILYKKSELLFGYDKAKSGIRKLDFSLIVEGQFDVVLAHQAGYSNTVAVSGTALTLHHVQVLERLSKNVVLALDSDRAGIAAMHKAASLMLARGFEVKVAALPTGADPADVIKSDPNVFKAAIKKSDHVIDYFLKLCQSQETDERRLKRRVQQEILPYILLLPNKIDQDHFEKRIASAIKTTYEAVHFEVERLRTESKVETTSSEVDLLTTSNNPDKRVDSDVRIRSLAETVLALSLALEATIKDKVSADVTKLLACSPEFITELISGSKAAEVVMKLELQDNQRSLQNLKEDLLHTLNLLRTFVVRKKLREHKNALRDVEQLSLGDEKTHAELMLAVQDLQNQLRVSPFTADYLEPGND